ncbi:MAG TPA: trypsin-like peptidase domain-containing protein, partial [Thermodesulfobacteriota bacterium]|nr:trypsin-like peptidase domain-containing protein [Thermodesulfobacteriota bacterium]
PRPLLLLALAAGLLALAAGAAWWAATLLEVRRELRELRAELAAERQARQAQQARLEPLLRVSEGALDLQQKLAVLQQEGERLRGVLEEARSGASVREDELAALEERLAEVQAKIESLERERDIGQRVIDRYGRGIGLIHVRVGFVDRRGRPLRRARGGAPYVLDFTGSGFVVDPAGRLLTNAHVARPWLQDAEAQSLMGNGWRPRYEAFNAYFPGVPRPFPLRLLRVHPQADVALVGFEPADAALPALPLDRSGQGVRIGSTIVLAGYPAGVEALLAKVEPQMLATIFRSGSLEVGRVAAELAQRGLIRPTTTIGHVSDLLPHQIVFDAQTAAGGSGGPIFSAQEQVIGISYGLLPDFAGSNHAVPIRFGIELLEGR